jgi:ABC-type transport system substrate-binding protein
MDPSPSGIRDFWHSMPTAQRGGNLQLYSNPAADSAINRAISEPDPARSRALYREAWQRIVDDVASVWLYENRNYMALNGRVTPVFQGASLWWRQLRFWSIPAAGRLPRDGS